MLVGNKYLPFDIGYLFLHENDETVEEHAPKLQAGDTKVAAMLALW